MQRKESWLSSGTGMPALLQCSSNAIFAEPSFTSTDEYQKPLLPKIVIQDKNNNKHILSTWHQSQDIAGAPKGTFFLLNSLIHCQLCVNPNQSAKMFICLQLIDVSHQEQNIKRTSDTSILHLCDEFTDNLVGFTGKDG